MKRLIQIFMIFVVISMFVISCTTEKTTDEVEKFQQLKSDTTAIYYDGIYPPHSENVSP